MASITSANTVYMLGITSLFPTPQQLQGYSADDVFSTDPLQSAETIMGVDGRLSAGFVFVEVKQGIQLQSDSASNDIFDRWWAAQQVARDIYFASGTVLFPSLGKKWAMTRGVLTMYPPMPDVGKTVKPRKYGITWEGIQIANG